MFYIILVIFVVFVLIVLFMIVMTGVNILLPYLQRKNDDKHLSVDTEKSHLLFRRIRKP